METTKKIEFSIADHATLKPAPINADWIIEGAPVARNALLSRSEDGSAFTLIWDCTAGLFEWRYSIDETVYILEGSVIVRGRGGRNPSPRGRGHRLLPLGLARGMAGGVLCAQGRLLPQTHAARLSLGEKSRQGGFAKGRIAQARRRRHGNVRRSELTS